MLTNRNTGAKQITISINGESQKNCDEFHEQIAIFCKSKPWLSDNVTQIMKILHNDNSADDENEDESNGDDDEVFSLIL